MKRCVSNYRPISVNSTFPKIFEKLIKLRLEYIFLNNIIKKINQQKIIELVVISISLISHQSKK